MEEHKEPQAPPAPEGAATEPPEDIAALKAALEAAERRATQAEARVAQVTGQHTAAVAAYKAMTVAANPEVPADLVTGDTVEAVTLSLEGARNLVNKVKAHLEAVAQARPVPAGAPKRSGPDMDSLSAEDKIKAGIKKK